MLRARLLVAAAVSALLVFTIVVITGGFTIRAGPLYFTAHAWRAPLLIGIAAFAAAALSGRAVFAEAAAETWQFLHRHAMAVAMVFAAAAAGIGIACGTYSASSADASGYISEARLLSSAQLTDDEPLARTIALPNDTWPFAPLGYRPGAERGELAPTYPPGLPLAIAPVRLLAGELAGYLVVPLLGGLSVLCVYLLAARLHSRQAGIAAAALLTTSPIFLFQIVQPMSDVAVTAWWLVALLFALSPLPTSALASGAAAGLAVLTRPNLGLLGCVVAVVAIGLPRKPTGERPGAQKLLAFAAGIVPAAGALALMQWRLFGHPLASGYGSASDLFAFQNIAPNAAGYVARLLHGEGAALGLAAGAVVLLAARRSTATPTVSLRRLLAIALAFAAVVVLCYLPYGVFAEWSYLRFLLPALPALFALTGALVVNATLRLPPVLRGTCFVLGLAVACSVNIVHAEQEQAFNLRRYESRYRLAGRYLDAALRQDTVVVTVQESGSVRYYANVPILRWDLLGADLDAALVALRSVGRHPVLLVEDWEASDLRRRFPTSATARLDWPARAEFGDETRVRLFDPMDRGATREWTVDRVH